MNKMFKNLYHLYNQIIYNKPHILLLNITVEVLNKVDLRRKNIDCILIIYYTKTGKILWGVQHDVI